MTEISDKKVLYEGMNKVVEKNNKKMTKLLPSIKYEAAIL